MIPRASAEHALASGHTVKTHVTAPKGRRGYLGKPGDLVFLGSMQPPWPKAREPSYRGTVLTRGEKLAFINAYTFAHPIPLCIDHAGGNSPHFEVPPDRVIGFVTGALVDHEDNCLITGYVDQKRPEMRQIIADMMVHRKKWGLSAYTRFEYENERRDTVRPGSKRITHVGVTLNPDFAEEDSYIFEYSTNPTAIARVVREREIQQRCGLANAECLEAWGVAPNVVRHVLSVLEANISQPDGRPNATALPPVPEYPVSIMASSTSGSSNTIQQPTAPLSPLAQNTALSKPAVDAMEGVTNTGALPAQQQQQQQPPPSPPGPVAGASQELRDSIHKALVEAQKNIADMSPIDKDSAITETLERCRAALREYNLRLDEMPWEFRRTYNALENDLMARREGWATELQKMGGADNNFNRELVEKMRSNATLPTERRQLAAFVEANKTEREVSQKRFEEERERLQKANEEKDRMYKEQLEKKRAADEELNKLREENERLKKRAVDTAPLTRALAPTGPFSFYTPKPQSAAAPPSTVAASTSPSPSLFNFLPVQQQATRVPSDAPSVLAQSALTKGSVPHSVVLNPSNQIVYNSMSTADEHRADESVPFRGTQTEEGFVSATGFPIANSDFLGQRDAHHWLSTFVISPEKTSFGRGFRTDNSLDPVFANTFQFLSEALATEQGMVGTPFNNSEGNIFRRETEAAVMGLSTSEYNRRMTASAQ